MNNIDGEIFIRQLERDVSCHSIMNGYLQRLMQGLIEDNDEERSILKLFSSKQPQGVVGDG